jgi:hypothetical protein
VKRCRGAESVLYRIELALGKRFALNRPHCLTSVVGRLIGSVAELSSGCAGRYIECIAQYDAAVWSLPSEMRTLRDHRNSLTYDP